MTILGPDVSSYEKGLDLSRLDDAAFFIAKASEGTYYTDDAYQGWRRQAASLGRPFIWYHFLSTEDAVAQVAHTKACIGDLELPGMLDFEPTKTMRPTMAHALDYADAAEAAGLNLRLVYLPRWYWQELGSPYLSGLTARGLYLVSSNYPGGSGNPEQLYPGDSGPGWQAYGGPKPLTPLIWQYTDKATDGGRTEDFNAFRGTVPQLRAYLSRPASTTTKGLFDMTGGTIPASIASQDPDLPDIAGKFPAGQPFDNETALIWTDERAAAANEHARQARDAVTALSALTTADDAAAATHLQQISASLDALTTLVHTLGGASGSPVDVQALAAALAAQLPAHLTLTIGTK